MRLLLEVFGGDVYIADYWSDDRSLRGAVGFDGEHRRVVHLDVRACLVGCESDGDGCDDSVGFLYRVRDGASDICESGADWDVGGCFAMVHKDARSHERDLGVVALGRYGAVSADRVDRDCAEWLAGCVVRVERRCVRGRAVTGGVADIGAAGGFGATAGR